ncbi:hypothetical protein ACT7DZ_17570 [Bacillus cereus]
MMEYLLSLSQDLLKVFLTIVVTAYANKFANNLFKKSKKSHPSPSEAG